MRAAVVAAVLAVSYAHAEPQPKKIEIAPFRDQLMVFADASGNTYVLKPYVRTKTGEEPGRIWFGPSGKPLYEQRIVGRTANGPAWSYQTWAPRISGIRPAYLMLKQDGTHHKTCADAGSDVILTQLTGDRAKQLLDRSTFMSEYLMRRPHALARDDSGVYYYIDRLAQIHGGKSFKVYIGKKGSMKQVPLTDVASDTSGEVFSTKSGDLRLDLRAGKNTIHFVRGEKKTELLVLDTDANSSLIFSDLGIYQFLGTLCDNVAP